jgi:preprotein translocase subunit Sss1
MIPRYAPTALKGTAYGLYCLVVGTGFFMAGIVGMIIFLKLEK